MNTGVMNGDYLLTRIKQVLRQCFCIMVIFTRPLPVAHAVQLKETYEIMKLLLDVLFSTLNILGRFVEI